MNNNYLFVACDKTMCCAIILHLTRAPVLQLSSLFHFVSECALQLPGTAG